MRNVHGLAGLLPLLGLLACTGGKPPGGTADKAGIEPGRLQLALTGVTEDLGVTAVAFSATDGNGQTTSAVVPLEAEPLPAARDPQHAGGDFADWLVVLAPGPYKVVATPIGADGKPSGHCTTAETSAEVLPDSTAEVLLVSRCSAAGNGALDATLVFEKGPVIDEIALDGSKFVCAGEAFAATVKASNPNQRARVWQWKVVTLPEGANEAGHCLTFADGRVAFTASTPGKYELRVQVDEGGARAALTFPVYVSDCDGKAVCPGDESRAALGAPPVGAIGACSCGGNGDGPIVDTGIVIETDKIFYGDGESVSVSLHMGARDPGVTTLEVALSAPGSGDAEAVTLTRTGPGAFKSTTPVALATSASTPGDGRLLVGPGQALYALYFPDKTQPALADLPVSTYSDVAFQLDPGAVAPAVEPQLALTDDESSALAKPVGTLLRQGSLPVQIATEEVMVWVRDEAHLAAFLSASGGTELARQKLEPAESGASYAFVALVKFTPDAAMAARLPTLDAYLGETRPLLTSKGAVSALLAQVLAFRLDGWVVAVNPRVQYQGAPSTSEGVALTHSMQLTPGCRPGDASRPCVENAPALWAWSALWDSDDRRINVGVLDMGFAPNADFRTPASGPLHECDMTRLGPPACGPGRAQGSPTVGNSFFGGRSWHGTGVVTTIGGVVNNGFGAAGVAGQVAVPMLYKYDGLAYAFEIGAGIRKATDDGASCINVSGGYPCNILMNAGPDFNICSEGGRLGICAVVTAGAFAAAGAVCAATGWIPFVGAAACAAATGSATAASVACVSTLAFGNLAGPMRDGARYAHRRGVPVVVSAGNALSRETLPEVIRDLVDLGDRSSDHWQVVPAVFPETISVGAVDGRLDNVHFFGDTVDIWAPITSAYLAPELTSDPASRLVRNEIGGTSAAAPYITGVIALMQAANRDLDPNTPGLDDTQKRAIVERIRALLRERAFSNAELVRMGFTNQPVERPRLVNPLAAVSAAAGDRVPDLVALGYDTSLGFSELDGDDDSVATARLLTPGAIRTGTILTLPATAPVTPAPDRDFYAFDMPAGTRPMEVDVILTFPAAHGALSLSGDRLRLSSRGGDRVVYRAVAPAGARVVFSVEAGAGQDNVYRVQINTPRPALPTLRIVEPLDADSIDVCADVDVRLRAVGSYEGYPDLSVPDTALRWFDGPVSLGPGNGLQRRFTPGVHDVLVRAFGDAETADVIRVVAETCISHPPMGSIVTPATDSGPSNPAYAYDGYDDARGMWWKDVVLEATASDIEDGALGGMAIVWKTNQTGVQSEGLGTGTRIVARLYSNSCFGTEHIVTVEATDSDGNTVTLGTRRLFIWTLC